MPLVEVGECVFDARLLEQSHGFEVLDAVGQEAYVNHTHITGKDADRGANRIIESWAAEMRECWPQRRFRIYRQTQETDVTIRFHQVRDGMPNWCEQDIEIITVGE